MAPRFNPNASLCFKDIALIILGYGGNASDSFSFVCANSASVRGGAPSKLNLELELPALTSSHEHANEPSLFAENP